MLHQPLQSNSSGSLTPQLEGAPCSQIHDSRITSPPVAEISDLPTSGEEKGQVYETVVETNGSFNSTPLS